MDFRDIIRRKPYLIWYTKEYDTLSEGAVIEAVLNGGDWDDVQELIKILGIERIAEIFRRQTIGPRSNYQPKVEHYFKLYFARHA